MNGFEAEYIRENMGRYLTLEECNEIQRSFFDGFPKLKDWIDYQHAFVRKHHYVETPMGRRRRFPFIDRFTIGSVLRQSVNTMCQSLASDMTTNAQICLADELHPSWGVVTSSVHDSIMLEIKEDMITQGLETIRRCMETPCIPEFDIPLKVDIAYGRNWAELGD